MTVVISDLSPADFAALAELRRWQLIRIDQGGKHAESLARLTDLGVVKTDSYSTDIKAADLTDDQRALGFDDKHCAERYGPGFEGGVRVANAPFWRWSTEVAEALLREHEGRREIEIDWNEFCHYVIRSYGQRNASPTVAMVAKRFGHTVEEVVEWVDGQYWAFRSGSGDLAEQIVELEGE